MSWPLLSSGRQAFPVGGCVLRLCQLPAIAHGTADIGPAEPVGFILLRVAAGPARRGSASLPAHTLLLRSGCMGENTRGRPAVPADGSAVRLQDRPPLVCHPPAQPAQAVH